MEFQFFCFFESFQEGDVTENLFWPEALKLGAFFGCMFHPCLVQSVTHGVFTAFAEDLGDLEDRSPFLQVQTLDLLDLCSGEARFLAHLLPSFGLSLSDRGYRGIPHS